jgi:WD40 repeat protein
VYTLALSSDGKRLLSADSHDGSSDHIVRIWDSEKGSRRSELRHNRFIRSAAFSLDGRLVVTVSDDRTARVWDPETGTLITELRGHQGNINSAVFSADGRLVVTASDDRTARVWDTRKGTLITELSGHSDKINTAVFSLDGRRVVTASDDSTSRVWDVTGAYLDSQALVTRLGELLLHLGRTYSHDECTAYFPTSIGAIPRECAISVEKR